MVNKALENFNHILLITFAFIIPLSVAGGNLLAFIILISWFLKGNYAKNIKSIINNKVALASILFFLVHLFGLLWTEDMTLGVDRALKMIEFGILIPVLINSIKQKNAHIYINSFLVAIAITLLSSFLIYYELIPPFKGMIASNPTPFMSHITHTPLMAISFYISIRLFYDKFKQDRSFSFQNLFLLLVGIMSFLNVFYTNGRAGYVALFLLLGILILQIRKISPKSFLEIILVYLVVFITAFSFNDSFRDKLIGTHSNLSNFVENPDSSVGRRILMSENSLEIIKNNPYIGVGTGDFYKEYESVKNKKTYPFELATTKNPHNMYLLVGAELGLLGIFFLFYMYYIIFREAKNLPTVINRDIAIAVTFVFIILNFSDSYFLGHFSTYIYSFFISICFAAKS